MTRRLGPVVCSVALLTMCGWLSAATALAADEDKDNNVGNAPESAVEESAEPATREVEMFQAMRDGDVDVKFIARSDHDARILIANKTNDTLQIRLPEAFAGVPLAQFGGGGRGGRGGGRSTTTGGGNQSLGGGLGGGGGGGGGFFSVPPEKVGKINVDVLCLDHGLADPSSSKPYAIVPAEEHIDRPAVIELLKAFGRGELQHGAAQAAAWHLNNDMSWQELAAKRQGTKRNINRPPYFSQAELHAAVAYANEAQRLAQLAQMRERIGEKSTPEVESSEARSTSD